MREKHEPWHAPCCCGCLPVMERQFDERMDEMYIGYRCPGCGAHTLRHLTRWEAQAEWEEKYAASGH